MKKQIFRGLLFITILSTVAIACQKENQQAVIQSKQIEKSGKNGFLAFEDELQLLKNALVPLSSNSKFRSILYKEVAKKFDGEDNVLIKTLINTSKKEGFDLESELNKNLPNGQNIQTLLNSFVRKGKQRHAHLYSKNSRSKF